MLKDANEFIARSEELRAELLHLKQGDRALDRALTSFVQQTELYIEGTARLTATTPALTESAEDAFAFLARCARIARVLANGFVLNFTIARWSTTQFTSSIVVNRRSQSCIALEAPAVIHAALIILEDTLSKLRVQAFPARIGSVVLDDLERDIMTLAVSSEGFSVERLRNLALDQRVNNEDALNEAIHELNVKLIQNLNTRSSVCKLAQEDLNRIKSAATQARIESLECRRQRV